MPVFPTAADAAIDALILAEMPDGSPVSLAVKIDLILGQSGIGPVPEALRRLLASRLACRLRRYRRKLKPRECGAA